MKDHSGFQRLVVLAMLTLAVAGSGGFLLAGCRRHQTLPAGDEASKTLYTCGMHPQVIQDHPGLCPICGMKLTPIRKAPMVGSNALAGGGAEPALISIDPVTIQNMNVRAAAVTNGPLRHLVRTVGAIDFNETSLADVTTKFKGWIEKLYVDATGQQVHRGDPLFEIYSPELYTAQTEYLLALGSSPQSEPGTAALKESARLKLKFWDISDSQIADLEKSRRPQKTLRVQAPMDGFVVDKMAVEGQMVDAGMKLYRLADLALVWVNAQIYEQDLPYLKLGQEATVTLTYLPDRKFRGRVTFIYPTVDEKTRTVRVRMEFHNPGYFLKPGMFATVEVLAELAPSALLVPEAAVLRSGENNTAFVALPGGKFEPRLLVLGPRAENNTYQVLSGLSAGERVVTSGQFLLDSESQLRGAIQRMMDPGQTTRTEPGTPTNAAAPLPRTAVKPAQGPDGMLYVCPMPEHVSIAYDHAGKCPICGMVLVPVTPGVLERVQPGGVVEYYTCPMPEHSDVHESKPGKCPRCSMTLIPVMKANPLAPPAPAPAPEASLPKLYTCPMAEDADVVSDKPGVCLKCEMKLVETSTVAHGKTAEANWRKAHPAASPGGSPRPQ
jgi:multidrug efflux pump subunit AcrA (membrane-fusion protein)